MNNFKSILFLYFLLLNINLMAQDKISYLALGDSYTIGEAVDIDQTWPNVLTSTLKKEGINIELEKIVAKTGWTTDELLIAVNEDEGLDTAKYDLVSLLIGVNNQYRGYGIEQYKEEFELLLQRAISLAGKKVSRVFVVSIPDYGVTTFAKENNKNEALIAKELYEYNSIARNISDRYGVKFFDITPISLSAIWDEDLIAKDKLHPSEKMYVGWSEYIAPGVYQLLK
tara:strand:- start:116958 stop:117638 length:681 start_codon:yes stop_codon:yes gene_type:complete